MLFARLPVEKPEPVQVAALEVQVSFEEAPFGIDDGVAVSCGPACWVAEQIASVPLFTCKHCQFAAGPPAAGKEITDGLWVPDAQKVSEP